MIPQAFPQSYPNPQGYQQHQSNQVSMATPPVVFSTNFPTKRPSKSRIKTTIDEKVLLTRTPDEETADGRVRNREASQKIRDTWIYKQVRSRQDEFTQYRKVSRDANTFGSIDSAF